eukprot:1286954-Amphidinium_carterae.1
MSLPITTFSQLRTVLLWHPCFLHGSRPPVYNDDYMVDEHYAGNDNETCITDESYGDNIDIKGVDEDNFHDIEEIFTTALPQHQGLHKQKL